MLTGNGVRRRELREYQIQLNGTRNACACGYGANGLSRSRCETYGHMAWKQSSTNRAIHGQRAPIAEPVQPPIAIGFCQVGL